MRLHAFIAKDLRILRLPQMGSNAEIRAFYCTYVHLCSPELHHVLFENVTKNRTFADERENFAVILNIFRAHPRWTYVYGVLLCVLRA